MVDGIQWRIGFKSKNQGPWFMIWKELWHNNNIVHAWVIVNSRDYIGR